MTEALEKATRNALTPRNMSEAIQLAELVAESDYCPKALRGKPGSIVVAMQYGMEIGLSPMSSLQNVAVINGRPAVWGTAAMALVRRHPLCQSYREVFDQSTQTAHCFIQRRGDPEPMEGKFSMEEAKKAGLLNRDTWKSYPRDMLLWKARARAQKAAVPEALAGLMFAEEARDVEPEPEPVRTTPVRTRLRAMAPKPTPTEPAPETKANGRPEPDYDSAERQRVVTEYTARIAEAGTRDDIVALFREARRMAPFENAEGEFGAIVAAAQKRTEELSSDAQVNREPGADG